jgi:anthranilate 1,2-dioxygenase small subunit
MTVRADIERAAALQMRIERLMTDYAHCIDDDRLEDWPDFFAADGRYRVQTRENHDRGLPASLIYCTGMGMLRDRVSALRTANIFEPHVYCHMVSAVRLLDSAGGVHHTRSNFTVTRTMAEGDMSIFACGRYLDRIVEDAGALRFKERTVVLDSRRIDTLLVIPI